MKDMNSAHGGMGAEAPPSRATNPHSFGRMFSNINDEMILRRSTCAALGNSMASLTELARKDSNIPAGYTYFGQFVDHDMSMDRTAEAAPVGPDDPIPSEPDDNLIQGRSPHLDLDSLYTQRPDLGVDLFDGPRFKIGTTTPVERSDSGVNFERALKYDLPRVPSSDPRRRAGKALIGDPRNDENLAVAQTHLMWLKFHNAVVDALARTNPGLSDQALFSQAKELVVKHYQFIVLHDFVRRFIDADVYKDVILDGKRRFLRQGPGEVAFMPLEFAGAAYRHGHSQVRERYNWNVEFEDRPFSLLFLFSEVSGGPSAMAGLPTLPTNWIADFRRLYDFGATDFPQINAAGPTELNFAKSIDPYIAPVLGDLPELRPAVAAGHLPFNNLAALNLRRGSLRGLPAGQDISRSISTVKTLSRRDMEVVLDEAFIDVMDRLELFDRTPLWLYLLIEAAVAGGDQLGELGSIIVAETFRTMIVTSDISILCGRAPWSPDMAMEALGTDVPMDTIPAVLLWMDAQEPIIDPLRDERL